MRVKGSTLAMASAGDAAIATLAEQQRGYITRRQLLQLGLSRQSISRRLETCRLIRVYTGVHLVGHLPTLPQDRAVAALLACGRNAVLSHGSAAALWGVFRRWEEPFEVTVPRLAAPPAGPRPPAPA
jgi:hypothetical protein